MAKFLRIAHRGASGNFPENSRVAFEKAIEARVDMIELDCQLTSDGHIVIFHDQELYRTTGLGGTVKDKTLEQLKRRDIGVWRKAAFAGERILTLEEALEVVNGKCDLCLDVKTYSGAAAGIELKLLFVLSHYDYLDRTIFSSDDYDCLRRVRELAPESRIGIIYGSGMAEDPIAAAEELDASSVHAQKELATSDFLIRSWEAGLDVLVWTVNTVREIGNFVSLGVQGIMTDYPEKFSNLIRR
jgi:glycerophosphoryl diester phosphodiesterase